MDTQETDTKFHVLLYEKNMKKLDSVAMHTTRHTPCQVKPNEHFFPSTWIDKVALFCFSEKNCFIPMLCSSGD